MKRVLSNCRLSINACFCAFVTAFRLFWIGLITRSGVRAAGLLVFAAIVRVEREGFCTPLDAELVEESEALRVLERRGAITAVEVL